MGRISMSNVNKSLHDEGFYTWYTLALNVFQEFNLDAEDFSNMDKCFHKIKVPFKTQGRIILVRTVLLLNSVHIA
jgi:hypothetical protein